MIYLKILGIFESRQLFLETLPQIVLYFRPHKEPTQRAHTQPLISSFFYKILFISNHKPQISDRASLDCPASKTLGFCRLSGLSALLMLAMVLGLTGELFAKTKKVHQVNSPTTVEQKKVSGYQEIAATFTINSFCLDNAVLV